MIRVLALAALILLGGCVSVSNYSPYIVEIKDQDALGRDMMACQAYAKAYQKALSVSAIASAGTQGTLANLPGAAVSPISTALGGLGSASSEAWAEIGLNGAAQRQVYLLCLRQKGQRSGAYLVLEPYPE